MSTKNRKMFNELRNRALRLGYKVRADRTTKHDRFVLIGKDDKEEYLTLVASGYSAGSRHYQNILADFNRLCEKLEPFPRKEITQMQAAQHIAENNLITVTNGHSHAPVPMDTTALSTLPENNYSPNAVRDFSVHEMKIYLKGSSLGITIPRKTLDKFDSDCAVVDLTADRKLMLRFTKDGQAPGKTAGKEFVAFYFKRNTVPFEFAATFARQLKPMVGRVRGQSLVTDIPMPAEFFSGRPEDTIRGNSLDDGAALKNLLNHWLAWAQGQGLDPLVEFDRATASVQISITEKKERRL